MCAQVKNHMTGKQRERSLAIHLAHAPHTCMCTCIVSRVWHVYGMCMPCTGKQLERFLAIHRYKRAAFCAERLRVSCAVGCAAFLSRDENRTAQRNAEYANPSPLTLTLSLTLTLTLNTAQRNTECARLLSAS